MKTELIGVDKGGNHFHLTVSILASEDVFASIRKRLHVLHEQI
jgi:hypothetical protein